MVAEMVPSIVPDVSFYLGKDKRNEKKKIDG